MTQTAPRTGLQVEWPTEPAGAPPPRPPRFRALRELPALIVVAFLCAVLIKAFLVQAFFIPSGSMEPTLREGDRVLVNKLAYRFREPRRGEVIVFVAERDERPKSLTQKVRSFLFEGLGVSTPDEKDFIKRIIGLPGDTIQVTEEGVTITPRDGSERVTLSEPYIKEADQPQGPSYGPFVVPDDSVFVMGDNRNNSRDSRSIGPIEKSAIIGKAFVKIWPPSRLGLFREQSYSRGSLAAGLSRAGVADPFLPALACACAARRRRGA